MAYNVPLPSANAAAEMESEAGAILEVIPIRNIILYVELTS